MGKICVAIARKTPAEAIEAAKSVEGRTDVVEIRLDGLENPVVGPFLEEVKTPLLFTNRPEWEGGHFRGPEEQRLSLLAEAVRLGAAYVDIEQRSDPAARRELLALSKAGRTRIISSWHNFETTPSPAELDEILLQMIEGGAHIGKIVTMALHFTDVLRVLNLQETAHAGKFPLIAFCMGDAGMISRVATLKLGGFMTYVSLDSGLQTAPGQLTVSELSTIMRYLDHGD